MNKTQLVDAVAQAAGFSKAEAVTAIDSILKVITEQLSSGESVEVVGFGKFYVKDRAARTGRDPRTGGALKIPAATVPGFKPGKTLKDAVNVKLVTETA